MALSIEERANGKAVTVVQTTTKPMNKNRPFPGARRERIRGWANFYSCGHFCFSGLRGNTTQCCQCRGRARRCAICRLG